jgi:hypothetical protein
MVNFGKKCKSEPVNTSLYNSTKKMVKARVNRWPSAYASGQLVREYKRRGGKYRCARFGQSQTSNFGSLDRWFREKWIDVCTGKPCGRKKGSKRKYPYCRPSRRISGQTPRTRSELSRSEIKRRCAKKRKLKKKRMSGFGSIKSDIHYLRRIAI